MEKETLFNIGSRYNLSPAFLKEKKKEKKREIGNLGNNYVDLLDLIIIYYYKKLSNLSQAFTSSSC